MNAEQLVELDTSFTTAAKALRNAWRLMKHGGMEDAAKEIADTVLDVETAAKEVGKLMQNAIDAYEGEK